MEIMSQLHIYFNSTLIRELRVDIENQMSLHEGGLISQNLSSWSLPQKMEKKMSQITILKVEKYV